MRNRQPKIGKTPQRKPLIREPEVTHAWYTYAINRMIVGLNELTEPFRDLNDTEAIDEMDDANPRP